MERKAGMSGSAAGWRVKIRKWYFRLSRRIWEEIKDVYRYSMLIRCPQGRRAEYSRIVAAVREEDIEKKKKDYTAIVDINPYSFI